VVDADARAARVVVPDYQLSLAIGREGQNARLAARLTGWRIDIVPDTAPDPATDAAADPAPAPATNPTANPTANPAADAVPDAASDPGSQVE
jgi:N utilization substance protein A